MDVQKLKNETGLKGSSSGEIASALRNFGQAASNSVAETVSAPVDAIAWALRKAGVPNSIVGDKPVMGSDWMAEKGFTRPTQEGASKMAGEFVGMVSPLAFEKSVATQLASALRNVKPSAGLSTEAVGGMDFLKPSALPQEKSMALAQQRAALPIEQGGLGLGPSNTAAERASAMGFNRDVLHGTAKEGYVSSTDITNFDKSKIGDRFSADTKGIFTTNDPIEASYYATGDRDYYTKGAAEGAIYPMLARNEKPLIVDNAFLKKERMNPIGKNDDTVGFWDNNQQLILDWAKKNKSDSVILKDETTGRQMNVLFEPEQLRSRFAAFDPFRKTAATAAAFGVAAPDLLAKENK